MSTVIEFTFPWGRYHATPWGRTVNESDVEWPPSPWRIARALIATWHERCPDIPRESLQEIVGVVSRAATYRLPEYSMAHTRHYFPDIADGPPTLVFDPHVVMARGGTLLARWPVDLSNSAASDLQRLLAALPYLGRADSICEAQLVADDPATTWNSTNDPGAAVSTIDLLVSDELPDLETLSVRTRDVRDVLRRPVPEGFRLTTYTRPAPSVDVAPRPVEAPGPVAVRFNVAARSAPPMCHALLYTEGLRRAALSCFGRLNDGALSPTLSGRDGDHPLRDDHGHAHYLALPSDVRNPLGARIRSLVVWAPDGLSEAELAAVARIRHLDRMPWIKESRPLTLGVEAWGSLEVVAPELFEGTIEGVPSTVFRSVTPFAARAHKKSHRSWEQHIERDLRVAAERRGLPKIEKLELDRSAARSFRSHRPSKERLGQSRPTASATIHLAAPYHSPFCLGPLGHFGLGLFAPCSSPSA